MTNTSQNLSPSAPEHILVSKYVGKHVSTLTPRVSIIIPAYDISEFIVETLESVFSQTYKNYEIILINDGSPDTDLLEKVIEPYREKLVYLRIENMGVGPARNVAMEHSRSELVAFLDGDDVWMPEFLESQVKFLEDNGYDMVYSDGLIFGDSLMSGRSFSQDAPSEGEVNFESLLDLRCSVLLSSTLARKQAVIDAGAFEWKKVRAQDFNLWLRMAQRGAPMGYQKKQLVKYRVRKTSLSGDSVMRIDREINSYGRIKKTFQLTDAHLDIIEKHLARLEAEKEIQLGKVFLLNGDYEAARQAFNKGNEYRRSFKLGAIITALHLAPGLFAKIYRSRRQAEIDYIPETSKASK